MRDDGSSLVSLKAGSVMNEGGASLELRQSDGKTGLILNGQSSAGGGGSLTGANALGNETVALDADRGGGGALFLRNFDGSASIGLIAEEHGSPQGAMYFYDASGAVSVEIDGNYEGAGRVITQELQITGGADLSEGFNVDHAGANVFPGAVLVIDPESPGELMLAHEPYDTRVAGVVSGAGNIKPGLMMGQLGSLADGEVPVALTGRVYVQVDATEAPIAPGDLLTTGALPGHAMRADDERRRSGAILGKALTGMPAGRGLVLALVSLQ